MKLLTLATGIAVLDFAGIIAGRYRGSSNDLTIISPVELAIEDDPFVEIDTELAVANDIYIYRINGTGLAGGQVTALEASDDVEKITAVKVAGNKWEMKVGSVFLASEAYGAESRKNLAGIGELVEQCLKGSMPTLSGTRFLVVDQVNSLCFAVKDGQGALTPALEITAEAEVHLGDYGRASQGFLEEA